jgi:phage gpG-like protein
VVNLFYTPLRILKNLFKHGPPDLQSGGVLKQALLNCKDTTQSSNTCTHTKKTASPHHNISMELTPQQFIRHLQQHSAAVRKYMEQDAPRLAGIEAVNHFRQSFLDGGFTDSSLQPWQPAKRTDTASKWYGFQYGSRTKPPGSHPKRAEATKPYKARKANPITNYSPAAAKRKTLSGLTGDLHQSIQYRTQTGKAIIFSNLPYANVHNEGGQAKVFGRKAFKMPKRQFIGHSQRLIDNLTNMMIKDINKIINL